jgi:hypothetical protein
MMDETSTMTQILINAGISGLTAWLASRWTLHGALHEKQWERKEAAYTRIIEALYQVKKFYDVRSSISLLGNMKPDADAITKGRAEGLMELERAVDCGGWHLSAKAGARLHKLWLDLGRNDRAGKPREPSDPDGCSTMLWEAIRDIAELAKEDLGVEPKRSLLARCWDRLLMQADQPSGK